MTEPLAADRQSTRFLALYALAWAGGSISYVPFLTLLLPVRITELAGTQAVSWLAYIAFVGAIAASLANIGFGWLSDVTRNRRGWIVLGLLLSSTLLVFMHQFERLLPLVVIVALWQCGLNMMLAPLAAWAGDAVPDGQKGTLGGLLAFAPAIGALSGALVTIPGLADGAARLWLVAAMVAACVLPAVVLGQPRSFPELMQPRPKRGEIAGPLLQVQSAAIRMWFARLLVQIAEAALFAYLLVWFTSLNPSITDSDTARVFAIVLFVAVPLALMAGRWADKRERPIRPLAVCAAISAGGLTIMSVANGIEFAIFGYVVFGVSAAVFLALHAAQTLRVLPRPDRRGRDLGLFNLTNTLPSLIMPWLTLLLVPLFGFHGLFALLAVLASAACLLLITLTRP